MIVIIDYGCGNPASIKNMLKKIGYSAEISSHKKTIAEAEKLILPGVGSFDHGMTKLEEFELLSVLQESVIERKTPILGICLGVQLFCNGSQEGQCAGLGWIDADVVKFDTSKLDDTNKVPHMAWADTGCLRSNRLFPDTELTQRYYYVHSYHLQCHTSNQILATTSYGYDFVAAVENDNIVGVQFHPEKSHRFGMMLLKNFVENY